MFYSRCDSCEMGLVGRGESHFFPLVTSFALSRNVSLLVNGCGAGAKQLVHWFLGGKVAVIQQGTIAWVGSPSPGRDTRRKLIFSLRNLLLGVILRRYLS